MADDQPISRILKMLEEGKITAVEAQSLIAAISATEKAAPAGTAATQQSNSAQGSRSTAPASTRTEETGGTRSFDFRWNKKSSLPVDLGALGRQISDAVRRIDPERILREARAGGRRWQEKMRHWGRMWDDDVGAPANDLGHPVARETESLEENVASGAVLLAENPYGFVFVQGGAERLEISFDKEVWAPTEEEAQARLKDLRAEMIRHPAGEPEGGEKVPATRVEVRVTAPEHWRSGMANLRIRVPNGVSADVMTVFGDVRIEQLNSRAGVRTSSGSISLEAVNDEVTAESVSGNLRAMKIGGAVRLSTRSGDLHAEHLAGGGTIDSVSGAVMVRGADGPRLEVKTVSGDATVEGIGEIAAGDIVIESVSGDVQLERARGAVWIKTVSGDATGKALSGGSVQGQAVSGDLRLEIEGTATKTISASTVSGDVELVLPESLGFRFTLDTQSGLLVCERDADDSHRTDKLWTGVAGDGSATLNAHTLSGAIHVLKTKQT